ncbi:uncharacterized protein LOC122390594 [Amphibalanus amphitrite]|uniref:uncharacterized protein LOC122390594 n=1 Tax=Amphibalanus amphitrite TaxID=1232801 RepID=UPI001C90A7BB|nr:uncharacterized protein LOC122390594 [Amphibalanus amphitrite]
MSQWSGPAGAASCWPAQSARRPLRSLLAVGLLVLLLAAGVVLVLLVLPGADDSPLPLSCERHDARMEVLPLPAEPAGDEALVQELFTYLAQPSPSACQRDLAIGAHVIRAPSGRNAMLWGGRHLCFDPEFSLVDDRCLVYAVRPPEDASFDVAADAYGCETHSFGPESAPAAEPLLGRQVGVRHHREEGAAGRLDDWVRRLGHRRRPISYLSLTLDADGFSRFLEEPPRALADSVRQLGVRLDVRPVTRAGAGASGHDLDALRRLYRGLLRLQQLGFYPFAYDFLDGLEMGELRISGLDAPVQRVLEVSWVRTACL